MSRAVVTLVLGAGVVSAFLVSPLLLLVVALAAYLVVRPRRTTVVPGSPGAAAGQVPGGATRRGDHGFGSGTQ